MLTEIRLENFKCFGKPTAIPLAPITVFIGPNGSGKSTPIQALMLLKQSVGGNSLETNSNLIKLGVFNDIVYGHELQSLITIGISATVQMVDTVPELDFDHVDLATSLSISRVGIRSQFATLSADGFDLESSVNRDTGESVLLQGNVDLRSRGNIDLGITHVSITINDKVGQPWTIGSFTVPEGQKERAERVNGAFRKMMSMPEDTIQNVYFVSSLERGFGEPTYPLAESSQIDFSAISSQRPQAVAATLKYREDELEGKLSDWYERVTGIRVKFALREGRTTFVESVTPEGAFNIVNEGFGSNQLVFLLGQLALAPQDSAIAIEEPESHLHPRAQYELANVLRETAIQEKKQLIITTHSEHILFSLLTAVASGQLATQDLAVNYFQKNEGMTEVRRLEVDDEGRVKGGLPGFFETELDQMDKYIRALSEQK